MAAGLALMALAACGGVPAVPTKDYETTIIGTLRQGQEKQVEEEYEAGDHIRGVIYAGLAKLLQSGAIDMDRLNLASAERGGVSDINFRVVSGAGDAVLDLGVVPSGTQFDFVIKTKGAYFYIFDNTETGIEELKTFSMGANRVADEE